MTQLEVKVQRSMFSQGKNNTNGAICTVDNISDDTFLGLRSVTQPESGPLASLTAAGIEANMRKKLFFLLIE